MQIDIVPNLTKLLFEICFLDDEIVSTSSWMPKGGCWNQGSLGFFVAFSVDWYCSELVEWWSGKIKFQDSLTLL